MTLKKAFFTDEQQTTSIKKAEFSAVKSNL